jgi:hypothetical protein
MEYDINDPTVKSAVLGRQVEDFLESDIGKYLVGRAESEAWEALEELKRVSWWRGRRIQYLQNRVYVTERVQEWLGNAISEGIQALNIMEEVE